MGKGDYDLAEKIIGNNFSLQLVLSAVLTAAFLLGNRTFLFLFDVSETTISYMDVN